MKEITQPVEFKRQVVGINVYGLENGGRVGIILPDQTEIILTQQDEEGSVSPRFIYVGDKVIINFDAKDVRIEDPLPGFNGVKVRNRFTIVSVGVAPTLYSTYRNTYHSAEEG